MKENWYALFISIVKGHSSEKSLVLMMCGESTKYPKHDERQRFSLEDELEMKRLKENGWTYKDIGEIFNLDSNTVYRRLKLLKRKEEVA